MPDNPMPKYDAAFSFLAQDLNTAQQLADAIDPLTAFVYARKQEELVGGSGMDTFGAVFGQQSRINVILYRDGYGLKGWTNYEQQVIQGRCLKDGWGSFVLFRVDESQIPKWVPSTYIYGDLKTMDIAGLAGVIRFRANAEGADARRESTEDRVAQHLRNVAFKQETDALATGGEAHDALQVNLEAIYNRTQEFTNRSAGAPLRAQLHGIPAAFGVNFGSAGFFLNYRNSFGTITSGQLILRFYNGRVSLGPSIILESPDEVARRTLEVIRTRALGWCWSLDDKPSTSTEVADFIIDELVRLNAR
jgi:hypothetical protein